MFDQLKLSRRALLAAAIATPALLAGCNTENQKVVYSGATTLLSSMADAAEAFHAKHPDINVDVQGGGTSKGIRDVAAGTSDFGGTARQVTAKELENKVFVPLALDGIAIIANAKVAVDEITLTGLQDLYDSRKAKETADLLRVQKSSAHGTFQAFASGLNVAPEYMAADVSAGSNGEVIAIVQAHANAVGYVSVADAEASIADGAKIKILKVDGIEPSLDAIKNGDYPLVRTLGVVHQPTLSVPAAAFLAFLKSEQGKAIFNRNGLVAR